MFCVSIRLSARAHTHTHIYKKCKVVTICMGGDYDWWIYGFSVLDSQTFIIKSLKDKHTCIWPISIKVANSIRIKKILLQIFNVNPNISSEANWMILDDKFGIKPYQIQLRRAKINVKEFME